MPSFKVQCPSCEAPVLIKNPNLVGTKVECPKCKYRFKVEEPAAASTGAAATATATAKDKKAEKKAKAGGKNKKLVPIIAGVVALVVLIGGGLAFFGGKKPPKPFVGGPKGSNTTGGTEEPSPPDEKEKKVEPVVPAIPGSDKVTTNLLPGQAVSVYRLNVEQLRGGPVYGATIDQPVAAMFRGTLGFTPDEVDTYVHCFAGDGRAPFGVIKLKSSAKASDRLARMPLKPKGKPVKGRDLYEFRSAPLLHAVANSLAMRSLFGEMFTVIPMTPATPPKEKPYGVCVYDTQHVLVGDYALLERFLGELEANGYPPFKSELDVTTVPTTPETPNGTPMPAPAPTPVPAPPKTPAAPPVKQPDPTPGVKSYSQVDAYRTIDPALKRALDELEADRTARPLLVYAEKFDARQYDPKLMKKEYQILATTLDPIASRLRYVGANVTAFGYRQFTANVRLTLADVSDARELAKEKVSPGLAMVTELLKLYLTTAIDFRDYTVPGAILPGMGFPPGTGAPGMGFPPGASPPGMVFPPGTGLPPGTGSPGMAFPPATGPGPGFPRPPMGMGIGEGPMGMGPMGTNPNGEPPALPTSHVDLAQVDNQLLIAVDLYWSDTVFRTVVAPRLTGVANQIKGKLAVFSAVAGQHALAAVAPKVLSVAKTTPRGTWNRAKTDSARLGLEYPPIQRVSLFVELLPHLGRDGLASQVNRNAAWYALEYDPVDPNNPNALPRKRVDNVTPGGEWVPELLVPSYPQSAWRATTPYAPDHTFGATNYVAIAGTGLDAARFDPSSPDPEVKKKLGMTGYGWGSRAEDVTDGLANTIYMMQTPPGLQQPWIAGGGATVRGFNEDDPMAGFRHANGGKPGTYALMGDGSVRFVPTNIDKKVLLALGTRAGGDLADLADVNRAAPLVDPPKAPTVVAPKPDDNKGTEPPVKSDPAAKPELAPPPHEKKM